jgi:threonine/homoserine/homoserine lactone efflux protein
VQTGLLVHVVAAAAGISAVLVASAQAFTVLKLVGAAYLAFLGFNLLRSAWRTSRTPHLAEEDAAELQPAGWQIYRQSFLANVVNPKAALFFVAVLPQFVSRDIAVAPQVLALGGLDIALGLAWWSLFVVMIARAHRFLATRRGRVAVDAVSGVALTGLGGALALTGRRG